MFLAIAEHLVTNLRTVVARILSLSSAFLLLDPLVIVNIYNNYIRQQTAA